MLHRKESFNFLGKYTKEGNVGLLNFQNETKWLNIRVVGQKCRQCHHLQLISALHEKLEKYSKSHTDKNYRKATEIEQIYQMTVNLEGFYLQCSSVLMFDMLRTTACSA